MPSQLKAFFFLTLLILGVLPRQSFSQGKPIPAVKQWHTQTLTFEGPETSESATPNPFTDFRLLVRFRNGDSEYVVRGFYAADGKAAETSATSGNIWKVRFSPDRIGTWNYKAELRQGNGIATSFDLKAGTKIEIANSQGEFKVASIDNEPDLIDFRNRGRLTVDNGFFRFGRDGPRWLKAGADSPENLLGFVDFDGTYRTSDVAREGESDPGKNLHRYPTHVADWQTGDPVWKAQKGKGIVGAINYLSSTGMNAVYFLTMNIEGDGKDVWPFAKPDEFSRFDCSKLAQWEIVFDHMQRKGILMHVVLQETENEKLLDDGDMGSLRQLYFLELVSRFAHHPALVWNLGEENGPASWSPEGQNSTQQKAMATYLKKVDPYQHPVVIHTHSTVKDKQHLLPDLLGHKDLDGLSFQVDRPDQVHSELIKWKSKAENSGHPWLIAMDEIGKWDTGVVPDSVDPLHDGTRHQVLWGSLMAGGAGVEWYFGAKQPHNDLTSEDWRQRKNMWAQTKIAIDFFEKNLPYWEMKPADELTSSNSDYCLAKEGEVYAIYLPAIDGDREQPKLRLSGGSEFLVYWLDPIRGGELQQGAVKRIRTTKASNIYELGLPPGNQKQDWAILVKAD